MTDWFKAFQWAVIIAVIFAVPVLLELKFIINRLKERFLAKKGYIRAIFVNQNRRALTKIVLPDELGQFRVGKGAYFIDSDKGLTDLKAKTKMNDGEAIFNLSNGKRVLEGNMASYYFIAGSSSPHDFFNETQMESAGTSVLVKQAIESARGDGAVELIKSLIMNKKLMMVLMGILIAIGLSLLFTFQTQNTINSIQLCKLSGAIAG